MILIKVLLLVFWLLIIPLCMGLFVQSILPTTKKTLGITFICGYLLSFASFEIVAIGSMLKIKYGAFIVCCSIFSAVQMIIAILGIGITAAKLRKSFTEAREEGTISTGAFEKVKAAFLLTFPGNKKAEPEALMSPRTDVRLLKLQYSKEGIVFWAIFVLIVVFQLVMAIAMAPFDGDDAYYVVESLLAQQADVMNTILPYTGSSTSLDIRHAMAVFTMWIAFIAKMSGVHATIVAHSVMPLVLIPLVYMIYLECGRILVASKRDALPVFMIFIALFQMFGNTSIYTAETFLMMRTWQGKAMVANMMLPLVLWLFLWRFDDCRKPGYLWKEETGGGKTIIRNSTWVLLFLVNMAAGIMSSMGIIFCGALIGLLSFILLIYTRNFKIIIKVILAMIPSAVYLLIYLAVWMP